MRFILTGTLLYNGMYLDIFSFFCCSLLDTFVSGTPIIQDGKLLGAVTHVFVKDSTRGYGTFAADMLEH